MPSWYPGRPYKPASIDSVEDDYSKEIPAIKKSKSAIDDWLNNNIVEPMANAGHGDIGAAIATVPSTIAEFMAPSTPSEFAPGMAGVRKTTRKAEAVIKDTVKKLQKDPNLLRILLKDVRESWKDLNDKRRDAIVFDSSENPHTIPLRLLQDIENDINMGKEVNQNRYSETRYWRNKLKNKIEDSNLGSMKNYAKYNPIDTEMNNAIQKNVAEKLIDFWNRGFNRSSDIYTAPKRLENRDAARSKKALLSKQEFKSMPSRNEYDQMLQGSNPGQQYFDEMGEEYRKFLENQNEEPDFFKDYIKNSWKGK